MGTRIDNGLANFRAELNDRLMHLRLDLLFEHNFPALENFLDMRPKLACLRIDDRKFLFDTESKSMLLCAHQGHKSLSKTTCCHPESPVRLTSSAQGRLRRRGISHRVFTILRYVV